VTRRQLLQGGGAVLFAGSAGAAGSRPWWHSPVRIFHPNMSEADVVALDVPRFVDRCAATNADAVVVSVAGIYAFYPSRVRYHYVSPALKGRDFLREVTERGHSAGLRIVARVDFSKAREEVFRDHPDWFSRNAAGKPSTSGGYYQACPNSPYAGGEFAIPVVQEILHGYPVDGFHINAGGFPGYCYCDHCREGFRRQSGAELPPGPDWTSAAWKRFIAWRYEAASANFASLQRAIQEVRPDVFWTGELAGLDNPGWMRNKAYDISILANSLSALMSTIDNVSPEPDTRWVTGMTASYDRSVGGRPPIINLKAEMRNGGWPRSAMPPAEYALCAWQALAHGAGLKMPTFGVPGNQDDERNLPVMAAAMGVLKKHAWVYDETRPVAPVALVWSQRTLDLYGQDDPMSRYAESAHGLYAALIESHIPCVVVGDDWLAPERLAGFRALAFANLACLSDAQCRAVAQFVERGGGLVATYETSLYDENGSRRPRLGLEQALGARLDGGAKVPGAGKRGTYLCLRAPHDALAWMKGTSLLPFDGRICPVRAAGGTAPLVFGYHANTGIPEEIDSPVRTEIPLLVANTMGQGRAAFFPSDIDRFYFRARLPDTRRLLGEAAWWALRGQPVLRTSAPAGVGVSIFEKPGFRFVHFVNATGRHPLDEVTAVSGVETSVEAPRRVSEVRTLLGGAKLAFQQSEGRVSFVLPRLEAYEVAVITEAHG
jgi:hypothetical protein